MINRAKPWIRRKAMRNFLAWIPGGSWRESWRWPFVIINRAKPWKKRKAMRNFLTWILGGPWWESWRWPFAGILAENSTGAPNKELGGNRDGNPYGDLGEKPWPEILGPAVRRLISANQGLNFNPSFFFCCSKPFSRNIFSIIFRAFNHQIIDKKN